MSEEFPTAKMPTSSGGAGAGDVRGKSATGRRILGKVEELGELVYKFNTKNQADLYLHTTEAIANYVGVEYGRNMQMLVKNGKEKTFIKPRAPRTEEKTLGILKEFKQ